MNPMNPTLKKVLIVALGATGLGLAFTAGWKAHEAKVEYEKKELAAAK